LPLDKIVCSVVTQHNHWFNVSVLIKIWSNRTKWHWSFNLQKGNFAVKCLPKWLYC